MDAGRGGRVSAQERGIGDERMRPTQAVAGFLAAAAIFAGLASIVYHPGRIGPAAMFVALLAAAMAGSERRLAGLSVAISTFGWLAGMTVAVLLDRPIF